MTATILFLKVPGTEKTQDLEWTWEKGNELDWNHSDDIPQCSLHLQDPNFSCLAQRNCLTLQLTNGTTRKGILYPFPLLFLNIYCSLWWLFKCLCAGTSSPLWGGQLFCATCSFTPSSICSPGRSTSPELHPPLLQRGDSWEQKTNSLVTLNSSFSPQAPEDRQSLHNIVFSWPVKEEVASFWKYSGKWWDWSPAWSLSGNTSRFLRVWAQ